MSKGRFLASKAWKQSGKPANRAALLLLLAWLLMAACPAWATAQAVGQDSFRLLHTLPRQAKYFTVDKLQQVYLVDSRNEVFKYGPDGREQFFYNNNTRGELAYVDATDPFNLLLFYPELQGVALLDRTLNETAWLLLFSAGIVNATAVALAPDNNIWVYDQANFLLQKIGRNGTVIATTDNLSAQLARPPYSHHAAARENLVYLYDPEQGAFVFDDFGQFHQLLEFQGYESLQIVDASLLFYKPGELLAYNPAQLRAAVLPLPAAEQQAVQAHWRGRRIYLLTPEGEVRVYERRGS
jgi:hypothetical protein